MSKLTHRKHKFSIESVMNIVYSTLSVDSCMAAVGQAVPAYSPSEGSYTNVYVAFASSIVNGGYYYTDIKGECVTKDDIQFGPRKHAMVGYGLGLRTYTSYNAAPGIFIDPGFGGKQSDIRRFKIEVRTFDSLLQASHSYSNLSFLPCYYYITPDSEPATSEDVWLWCTDVQDVRRMRKSPIPFILTGLQDLLNEWGYGDADAHTAATQYGGTVRRWCEERGIDKLYIGHDASLPGPTRIITTTEYAEQKYKSPRTTSDYKGMESLALLDVNRYKLCDILRSRTMDVPSFIETFNR